FVAAGYGFELEVFGPDGSTAVLLDERAGGTRTSSDIPAEIRRDAYQEVQAAHWRGCEGELLRIACRTGGLDQGGEACEAAGVNAEIAVRVLERDGAGRRWWGSGIPGHFKDLVGRANAGVLLDIGPRCSRGTDDLQAPIGHVGRNNFVA